MTDWLGRISFDPNTCRGAPCTKGTRHSLNSSHNLSSTEETGHGSQGANSSSHGVKVRHWQSFKIVYGQKLGDSVKGGDFCCRVQPNFSQTNL